MAKDPQQAAKVSKNTPIRGDEPGISGNHPWSMASKIAAGLFGTIVAPLLVALTLKLLDSPPPQPPAPPNAGQVGADASNSEPAAGSQPKTPEFVSLFNGKDFSGWIASKDSHWSVDPEHRTLVGRDPQGVKDRETHWIYTEKDYSDFRLRFEYRYRGASVGGLSVRRFLAGTPENRRLRIQMISDDHESAADLPTGNVSRLSDESKKLLAKALKTDVQRPTGDWNRAMIEYRGPHLRMWINRKLVQDTRPAKDTASTPERGTLAPKDRIGLQVLVGRVEFRNVDIEELPPAP